MQEIRKKSDRGNRKLSGDCDIQQNRSTTLRCISQCQSQGLGLGQSRFGGNYHGEIFLIRTLHLQNKSTVLIISQFVRRSKEYNHAERQNYSKLRYATNRSAVAYRSTPIQSTYVFQEKINRRKKFQLRPLDYEISLAITDFYCLTARETFKRG